MKHNSHSIPFFSSYFGKVDAGSSLSTSNSNSEPSLLSFHIYHFTHIHHFQCSLPLDHLNTAKHGKSHTIDTIDAIDAISESPQLKPHISYRHLVISRKYSINHWPHPHAHHYFLVCSMIGSNFLIRV